MENYQIDEFSANGQLAEQLNMIRTGIERLLAEVRSLPRGNEWVSKPWQFC